ncbi:MAG: helix-turn-helix transcriptional regulator, partial [Clostridia bacterium]|nr:helix-turn-helix transcriptional regulator [Clostridia bacterium]
MIAVISCRRSPNDVFTPRSLFGIIKLKTETGGRKMNIGQQIAKYRKEKRLTQEQLGEAVGVTSRTVSKWETGLSLPDVVLIPPISSALGITLDELFDIKPKEKQKDLSETIREAVADALGQVLPDLLEENLDELMPSYLN